MPALQRLPDTSSFPDRPRVLPELREQRRRTLTLIDVSERGGQARMVEMNQQVLINLDRMISAVEKTVTEDADTTHAS